LQHRLTLLLGLSLAGLAALLLAGVHILPRQFAEDYMLSRLDHEAESLYAYLQVDPDGRLALRGGRLALVYNVPLSGHYYRIVAADGRVLRSRSLWDEDFDTPIVQPGTTRIDAMDGPFDQKLLSWSRGFLWNDAPLTVTVAEDIGPIDERIRTMGWQLFGVLTLLFMLLLLLQRWLVTRSLKPLGHAVQACRLLEEGRVEPLPEQGPREIAPLVSAINRLTQYVLGRLKRSRNTLGDLAHALKTPLAVLGQMADSELAARDADMAARLRRQVDEMQRIIERELKRARLAGGGHPGGRFEIAGELASLVQVMRSLHHDRELDIALSVPADRIVPADREDMLELFGNLLDNACKWARSRVQVTVDDAAGLRFMVEDDGPGVPDERLAEIARRGVRADETVPGHGLGLSIVADVVEQYGGRIAFGRSATLGGLRVEVVLSLSH
jgi:signal transduction histidine kinase